MIGPITAVTEQFAAPTVLDIVSFDPLAYIGYDMPFGPARRRL